MFHRLFKSSGNFVGDDKKRRIFMIRRFDQAESFCARGESCFRPASAVCAWQDAAFRCCSALGGREEKVQQFELSILETKLRRPRGECSFFISFLGSATSLLGECQKTRDNERPAVFVSFLMPACGWRPMTTSFLNNVTRVGR